MKGFGIYVKNDLLEPKHFKAIGQALWLYLWLLDKMTSISEDGVGKVLGGKPIKFETIKADLPMSPSSYTRYIAALEDAGYITALRTPYGHVFTIKKAKKIFRNGGENHKKAESQKKRITNLTTENHKFDGNKEDNTVDNTNTCRDKLDKKIKNNKKDDMSWNRQADDYEEGVVDLETGEVSAPTDKPKKKYPNAPAVRKVFLEVLGKNPADWKKNTTILQACENLYTERGIDKIKNALEFYKDNKDLPYCPVIDSPVDLDRKYTKLSRFKTNHGH